MDYAIIDTTPSYSRAAIRTALLAEFRTAAQEEGVFWLRSILASAGVVWFSDLSDIQIIAALAELEPAAGPLTLAEMAADYQARAAADADGTETMEMLCGAILNHVLQPAAA